MNALTCLKQIGGQAEQFYRKRRTCNDVIVFSFPESKVLAELSNKVFEHNFGVLSLKIIVTKLDFAYQPLIRIKQNGGQIVAFNQFK